MHRSPQWSKSAENTFEPVLEKQTHYIRGILQLVIGFLPLALLVRAVDEQEYQQDGEQQQRNIHK